MSKLEPLTKGTLTIRQYHFTVLFTLTFTIMITLLFILYHILPAYNIELMELSRSIRSIIFAVIFLFGLTISHIVTRGYWRELIRYIITALFSSVFFAAFLIVAEASALSLNKDIATMLVPVKIIIMAVLLIFAYIVSYWLFDNQE